MFRTPLLVLSASLMVSLPSHAAEPLRADEGIGFYIGIDSLATITSGTFAGQANPNYGRLTFLFDHGNHFHGIGAYSYSGTADAPVINGTNANNRLPELYSRIDPLPGTLALTTGSGDYAGKWVSGVLGEDVAHHEYSYLGMSSIQSLSGGAAGSAESVLFNSSSERWNAALDGVQVALKLEYATPGLKVAANGDMDLFDSGNLYLLGSGNSFDFLPTFWVDSTAAAGTYTAQFSLVNLGSNTAVRDSGTFYIDFAVPAPVPEPASWALFVGGLLMLSQVARRRR
ncbi:all3515 family Zur-repressed PEP-CTERM protein [Methyloversatilis thermotolerans]|uniref:all3515 family Zur-repressed PEP-CTERM protein n=1 Tax=Methyloversatilis thermotolerans TaxID=1346290 RepID=UPI0003715FE9|nr:all3515 family Zur-repressed PEP-CTERM protein [Methyloversatilis thermotolerans]